MGPVEWFTEQSAAVKALVVAGVLGVGFVAVVVFVAFLVVAAAVVGTFAVGAGQQVESAPEASFGADQAGDRVTITHAGGDAIRAGDLVIYLDDGHDHVHAETWAEAAGLDPDDEVTAGMSVTVGPLSSGDELRVVYEPGGGPGTTLFEYTVE